MKYSKKLKESIFEYTIEGIIKYYGCNKDEAINLVDNSGLDRSIKIAPDMIAHCSQEQLVDMVMN